MRRCWCRASRRVDAADAGPDVHRSHGDGGSACRWLTSPRPCGTARAPAHGWRVGCCRHSAWRTARWCRASTRRSIATPATPGPIPALSIGNLTVGGTGKTPVSAYFARRLREAGASPTIVMRGYGSDEILVHEFLNPDVPVVARVDRCGRRAGGGTARRRCRHPRRRVPASARGPCGGRGAGECGPMVGGGPSAARRAVSRAARGASAGPAGDGDCESCRARPCTGHGACGAGCDELDRSDSRSGPRVLCARERRAVCGSPGVPGGDGCWR